MNARDMKRLEAFRGRLHDAAETLRALQEDYELIDTLWRHAPEAWEYVGGDLGTAIDGVEEATDDLAKALAALRKEDA